MDTFAGNGYFPEDPAIEEMRLMIEEALRPMKAHVENLQQPYAGIMKEGGSENFTQRRPGAT